MEHINWAKHDKYTIYLAWKKKSYEEEKKKEIELIPLIKDVNRKRTILVI